MKLGNKIYLVILFSFLNITVLFAEEKITSSPLVNIEKIKPSFEESDEENEKVYTNENLKKKKKNQEFKFISSYFNWT